MKSYLFLPVLVGIVLTAGFADAQSPLDTPPGGATSDSSSVANTSLLTNPEFVLATKDPTWPDDWGKGAGISWETENGKHFLRLTSTEPGKMIMAYREMPIPAGVKTLQITIRFRSTGVVAGEKNYMDARAIFHFLDASRKQVVGDPKTLDLTRNDGSWNTATEQCVVPTGAATLVLMPSLFKVTAGTLDLGEVSVTAVN